jgi:hypothetical protein
VEVLEFLMKNHPDLHAKVEIERDWIWLADVNLSGEANKPVRESLKAFGFQYKFSGDHPLPSGKTSRWSHHCLRPIPRWCKKKKGEDSKHPPSHTEDVAAAALGLV